MLRRRHDAYFGGVLVGGAAGAAGGAGAIGVSGTAVGAFVGAGAAGADCVWRESGSSTDVGVRVRVPMICSTYASSRNSPPPHHVMRVSRVAA